MREGGREVGGVVVEVGGREREETKEVTNVTSDQKNSHLNNRIQCKGYTYFDIICIRLKTLFAVLYIVTKVLNIYEKDIH